jgi:Transcriptional regulators
MATQTSYQITLEEAKLHYELGDLTVKGLVHFYIKIRLEPGYILKETKEEICETLGISRAAFYNALSRLKAEGSINWSTSEDTRYSISLNDQNQG